MGKIVLYLLLLILLLHVLGTVNLWYISFWWLDVLMHLLGGAWVALFFVYIFIEKLMAVNTDDKMIFLIFALGFTALIGVLWEFYEYGYDVFLASKYAFGEQNRGVFDTLSDLFNDLVGATVAIGAYLTLRKEKPTS